MARRTNSEAFSKTSIMIFRTNEFIAFAADSKISLPSGRPLKYDEDKIGRLATFVFLAGVGSTHLFQQILGEVPLIRCIYPPMLSASLGAIPCRDIVNTYMSARLSHLRNDKPLLKREMGSLRTEAYLIDPYSVVKISLKPLVHTPWNHSFEKVDPREKVIFRGSGTPILQRVYRERFGENGENHPANMEVDACIRFMKDCIWEACQEDWGSGGRINVFILGKDFCARRVWGQANTRYASLPYMELTGMSFDENLP